MRANLQYFVFLYIFFTFICNFCPPLEEERWGDGRRRPGVRNL